VRPARSECCFVRPRHALLILTAALFGLALVGTRAKGDGAEYLLTAHALAHHATPEIRATDVAWLLEEEPRWRRSLAAIAAGMDQSALTPLPSLRRAPSGAYYSLHFWFYSLVSVPFLWLTELLRVRPLYAFSCVNALAAAAACAALRRRFRSVRWQVSSIALFVLSGTTFYLGWPGPEVLTAAAVLVACLAARQGRTAEGLLAGALASLQNPSAVFLLPYVAWATRASGFLSTARVRVAAGVSAVLVLLPYAFFYAIYRIPNLIAHFGTDYALISTERAWSLFFDLDEGMLVGLPGVLVGCIVALGMVAATVAPALRARLLVSAAATAVLVAAMSIPTFAIHNWNSDNSGVIRYAYWIGMSLLELCLELGTALGVLGRRVVYALAAGLQVVAIAATGLFGGNYNYVRHGVFGRAVLERFPAAYDPVPEIFYERTLRSERPGRHVVVFPEHGPATKILVRYGHVAKSERVCPGERRIESRSVRPMSEGWRYLNAPFECGARVEGDYDAAAVARGETEPTSRGRTTALVAFALSIFGAIEYLRRVRMHARSATAKVDQVLKSPTPSEATAGVEARDRRDTGAARSSLERFLPRVEAFLRTKHVLPVLLVSVAFATLYAIAGFVEHRGFRTALLDLGIYDQAMRGYAHGRLPRVPLFGIRFPGDEGLLHWTDHFTPVLVVLTPLYWIHDGPESLLVAQALLFASALPAVWLFGRRALGVPAAYALALAYGFSWPIQHAVWFPFHQVAFAVPILAWAIERYEAGRYRVSTWLAVSLLVVREDMGLVVSVFGVLLALRGEKRRGWALAIGGIAAVWLTTSVLIPLLGGSPRRNWTYWHLGATPVELLVNVVRSPLKTLEYALSPSEKVHTLLWLFAPMFFMALRSRLVWLAVPPLAIRMLSDSSVYWTTAYHYNAFVVSILFCAAAEGAASLPRPRLPALAKLRWGPIWAFAVLVVALISLPAFPGWRMTHRSYWYPGTPSVRAAREALTFVPDGAFVAAANTPGAHLTRRAKVIMWTPFNNRRRVQAIWKLEGFHWKYLGDRPFMDAPWVLADIAHPQFPFDSVDEQRATVKAQIRAGYRVVFQSSEYVVLHRPEP